MNTLAYLFVFAAILMVRAVSRGRATNIAEDISDAFLAAVQGDSGKLREVLNRTGDATSAPVAIVGASVGKVSPRISSLLQAAVRRGSLAKGYRLGATGPTMYDCSGLVWQACKDTGAYSGVRFTTSTFHLLKSFTEVPSGDIGAIVVWRYHHMGIVSGPDQFYSAKNPRDGIGYSKISTWNGGTQGKPRYYVPTNALPDSDSKRPAVGTASGDRAI